MRLIVVFLVLTYGKAKIHRQLAKHYWWPQMCANIATWNHECRICASHSVGRATRLHFTQILVAGLFDPTGVDFIKFPKSKKCY